MVLITFDTSQIFQDKVRNLYFERDGMEFGIVG
jgi:hypothetical protein